MSLNTMPTSWDDFRHEIRTVGEYVTVANNTEVYRSEWTADGAEFHVLLHGHEIAIVTKAAVYVRDCGYVTYTTYDRLKRLLKPLGATVCRRNGVGMLTTADGRPYVISDGSWTEVAA